MQKFLVIQTAFIGDVVLASGMLETLHQEYPDAAIDILVRNGNESLFIGHPFLHEVLVWHKTKDKYTHLIKVLKQIRHNQYDLVINVQRFAATGFLTAFSGAKRTIGFDKNPFSFFFTDVVKHAIGVSDVTMHEIERNHALLNSITLLPAAGPKLYPGKNDLAAIDQWVGKKFICIAPASVWFTKQFPAAQWVSFIDRVPKETTIYLLGAPGDQPLCENIINDSLHGSSINLAGKLNFLQSAALMAQAEMNYVNDSAPMHFASAVNAPVTAVYCATIPGFGFGPLSYISHIVEVQQKLSCRPCGLHGHRTCPEKHFHCAKMIHTDQLLAVLPS